MGWFTSNISGTPNLYPTKHDYARDEEIKHSQQVNDDNTKLHPIKHKFSQTSNKQNQIKKTESTINQTKRTQAKKILSLLHSKTIPYNELLTQLQKQVGPSYVCGKMAQDLKNCLKIQASDKNSINKVCSTELSQYKQCLAKLEQL